jgi:glycerophosphoryl diester phosphodiesterase
MTQVPAAVKTEVQPMKVFHDIPTFIVHRAESVRWRSAAATEAREILAVTNWLEADVRRSADGRLVVFHNETVPSGERTGSLQFDSLASLGVRSLEQFITDLPRGFCVVLDVKNSIDDAISPVQLTTGYIAVEATQRIAKDRRVLLTSFDPSIILRARQDGTPFYVGLTTWQPVPLRESIPTARSLSVDVLAAHIDALRPNGVELGDSAVTLSAHIDIAHQAGLQVACWGGEELSISDIDYLVELGIDAIYIDKDNLRRVHQHRR